MGIIENGTLEELWEVISEKLTENSEPYAQLNGTYEIRLLDEQTTHWLSFTNGSFAITDEKVENPDCTLKMNSAIFRKFLKGNLNSMTAFMTGKLKVDGNIGLALKLEQLLKQYQF